MQLSRPINHRSSYDGEFMWRNRRGSTARGDVRKVVTTSKEEQENWDTQVVCEGAGKDIGECP